MFQFLRLIVKNLGRNKRRTGLTALAVIIMVTICVEMQTIIGVVARMVAAEGSQSRLMVTERWVEPSRIPRRYLPALAHLKGVDDWRGPFARARKVRQEG
jgi:hypothetical protein